MHRDSSCTTVGITSRNAVTGGSCASIVSRAMTEVSAGRAVVEIEFDLFNLLDTVVLDRDLRQSFCGEPGGNASLMAIAKLNRPGYLRFAAGAALAFARPAQLKPGTLGREKRP